MRHLNIADCRLIPLTSYHICSHVLINYPQREISTAPKRKVFTFENLIQIWPRHLQTLRTKISDFKNLRDKNMTINVIGKNLWK